MKYTPDRSLVLSVFDIGENQSETPEGYLYCRAVPIARVGTQQYLNAELEPDAQGGPDGVIHVMRQPEDVFHEDTIASFEGKPVTDDHPPEMLNPENIHEHEVGTILNVRRGSGDQMDFLIADLLITRKNAIAAVRAGKRQVSCGYGSEYESLAPGRARQHTIIGNHVALVERGRCGPSCAIGDEDMVQKKIEADKEKSSFRKFLDGFKKLVETTDAEYANGEEGELTLDGITSKSGMESHSAVGGDTHVHLHMGPNDSTTIAPTTDKKPTKDKKMKDKKAAAKDEEGTAEEMEESETTDAEGEEEDDGKKSFLDAMSKHYDAEMKKVKDKKGTKDKKASKDADKDDEDEDDKETKDAAAEEEGEAESEGSVESADAASEEEEDKDDKKKDNNDAKIKDAKKATKDSAPLKGDYTQLKSDVEILAPGLSLPTFDSAQPQKATLDGMCLLRRRALAASAKDQEGADVLSMLNSGKKLDLKSLTCDQATVFFNSAVAFARDRNTMATGMKRGRTTSDTKTAPASNADFNARTAAFYESQRPKSTTKSA